MYTSNLKPLYTAFLHSIKRSRYKMGIKFDKNCLVVEQNNYLNKILNAYVVYNLDAWPKILLKHFTIKNCLFGATSIVKDSDKEEYE